MMPPLYFSGNIMAKQMRSGDDPLQQRAATVWVMRPHPHIDVMKERR